MSRGVNLDEDFVGPGDRVREVGECDRVGLAVAFENECFHGSVELKFTMGNSV